MTHPSRRLRSERRLGDVIEGLGFASREVIEAAVEHARRSGEATGQVMLAHGVLTQEQLARALAERFGLDHLDLTVYPVDLAAGNLVGAAVAKRHGVVSVGFVGEGTLLVAMTDPSNVPAIDDIAMITGLDVRRAVASEQDIAAVIAQLDRDEEPTLVELDEEPEPVGSPTATVLESSAEDAPVIRLVHGLIGQAIERGASDVHLDPTDRDMQVRLRVDGVMWDAGRIPRRMVGAAISRIKIMADLDIAERRVPQDGRFTLAIEGRTVDMRLVSLPTVHGESIVMRILDRQERVMGLDELGMDAHSRELLERGVGRLNGAVLVTGPTGSGKTTTLYAALAGLRTPERTVITIEDPVEYRLSGVKQVQVNAKVGLSFAAGLRSMLRADPDVIMLGEIRDRESAQIAIESSLTGHLVLSTLHTNDAPTAVTRLVEMGIEPFLVASSVSCVVAQRLARALCSSCSRPVALGPDALRENGFDVSEELEAREPVGCVRCGGTGYRGRVGLFEVMLMSEETRALVVEARPAAEIAMAATGMRRLREDGLDKVRRGLTSIAEAIRVTGSE